MSLLERNQVKYSRSLPFVETIKLTLSSNVHVGGVYSQIKSHSSAKYLIEDEEKDESP